MKLSTILLTLLLGLGIAYSIFKLFNGHGGSGLGDFIDGLGYTSLIIFFTALTTLIFNFRRLKKQFDTLLFLLLGLPMTVMAVGGLIQNTIYNRTPNLSAKYPRPVTEKDFAKDSLLISVQVDSLVALRNRETHGIKVVSSLIDTIIYSQTGNEIFVVYAQQFEPNHLGNDLDPAYLSADERDSIYWHLQEGTPNAEQMSGSYHNIADLKKAVRKFYFNQYSFVAADSLKENYFWKRRQSK
jgi:hypothetical protein